MDLRRQYLELDSEDGELQFQQHLLQSLERIQKRLGLERFKQLDALMREALASAEATTHEAWIHSMLCDYYDPMYQYQMAKSAPQVVFRGDYAQVLDWCRARV